MQRGNQLVEKELENQKNVSVLVAEDDVVFSSYLARIIKKYDKNINVIQVYNGLDAVNTCLDNSQIDLIFLDIIMPEMNGYEALRSIREFQLHIPIIIISNCFMPSDKLLGKQLGCTEYLSKDMTRDIIEKTLQKYLY